MPYKQVLLYSDGGMAPTSTNTYGSRRVPSILRILIADDHEAIRKGVCAILSSRLDIEVCGEAVNGREAIDKAKELNPDVIILDVTMPVLDGFEAARHIRKLLPDTPIIMLTMHESDQLVDEAKKLGVKGYVAKSQAGQVLLQAINTVLNNEMFYPQPARAMPTATRETS